MRFNFISETGDGMGIVYLLLKEGNDARMWIRDSAGVSIGNGLIPRVGDIEDLVHDADKWEDIYVFDGSGNGLIADGLRAAGFAVFGGSLIADRLEKDRKYAMQVMKDAGIKIPKTTSFNNWDKALAFVQRTKNRLVYKPSKRLGEMSPSLVSYDQADMVELLQNLRDTVEIENPEFDLQEFQKGVEISSEAYFDGTRFLPIFNHTFERKQLMNGNLGPSGGCTGNVVWSCDGECPICKMGLRKMEGFLRSESFVGQIDLNGIATSDALYGLEFTPRFGYDATPTLVMGLLNVGVGEFFSSLAKQKVVDSPLVDGKFAASVRVTIPPWPTEEHTAKAGVPVRGLSNKDMDEVYWYNVKAGQNLAPIVSAGAWGIMCLFVGQGNSIASAFKRPYQLAEQVRIPDKQYRTDLVEVFEESWEELNALF